MREEAMPCQKSMWVVVVEWLIALVAIAGLIYVFWVNDNETLKMMAGIVLVVAMFGFAIFKRGSARMVEEKESGISKVVLLDEEGESAKEWYIRGVVSLLIGKSSHQQEVDIDLGGTEYAALISKQHAVLNHANGHWYIEDADSQNGTGLQKANQKRKVKLERPEKLDSGDVIYIANTRLLLK